WSAPVKVAGTYERPARGPSLASHGRNVFVAWTVGEDRAADISIARSTDGGETFGAPTTIAQTPGYSDAPKVVVDADGILHVAWAEHEGGWGTRASIRYAQSRDHGTTFEPARTVSGAAPSAAFPSLAVDRGHVWILWERYRRVGELPRGLEMAFSPDG